LRGIFSMTESTSIRYERTADGIVTLVLDDPTKSVNTMSDSYRQSMDVILDRLEDEIDEVTGIIVTSAKKTFFAGGDLKLLLQAKPGQAAEISERCTRAKGQLRRLETLGRPVVAAINGSALGGGAEIALACHHRIMIEDSAARIGFPEVTLGLLPGGGGIVRSTRLVGILRAVNELLLTGRQLNSAEAIEFGLVDESALDMDELLAKARTWIHGNRDACQPWDLEGFRFPGGDMTDPAIATLLASQASTLRKRLRGAPVLAPHNIQCAAVDGALVDVDTALTIETRYYVELVVGQLSKNSINAFFDRQSIAKGTNRPIGFERSEFRRIGVLGAGMMGAGIAYSCAAAGLDVVLKDVSLEVAERGKSHSAMVVGQAQARGLMTQIEGDQILARIKATGDLTDLAGCEAVVEAVFEDADLKKQIFRDVESFVDPAALLGSNTSTLPISDLAMAVSRPTDFIGLHFFSPVDRMALVEIIRGEKTSDATLARAFDLVRQIRKTPIIVRDSRGFFTSRVFGKFTREGVSMLADGVPAASIEQASQQAGYPVPALQLVDELSLTLPKRIRQEAMAAALLAGEEWVAHPSEPVFDTMVDDLGRTGRVGGSGFYEYSDGKRVGLWKGLSEAFGSVDSCTIPFEDLIDRLLFSEALEAVKCLDEKVLTSVPDANVGSLIGIGFPTWTGGVLQFVNGYPGGIVAFVARAETLARRYGVRFEPPESLLDRARAGELVG
jgi:3-hydroxyacyl-CoA dehydrogenase / enoyl-CoA hydratase / 3-hydroxybutyryl-CoA epimerase